MECRSCGNPVEPEAQICLSCGAKVLSAQDEARLNELYEKLGSEAVYDHCDAATTLINEYGMDGFNQLAKAARSGDDIQYDTALWAFLYELDRYRDKIDQTLIAQKLKEIMPAIIGVVESAKLQPSIEYLSPKINRTLSMLEKHADASALPALRSLMNRVQERRQKDGFRREYIQGDGYGGWLDNDGWDKSVKRVIDAIERRENIVAPPPAQVAPPPEPVGDTRESAHRETQESVYSIKDNCIGCGLCEQECPIGAIHEKSGKFVIDANECICCGACAAVCPVNAVFEPAPAPVIPVSFDRGSAVKEKKAVKQQRGKRLALILVVVLVALAVLTLVIKNAVRP